MLDEILQVQEFKSDAGWQLDEAVAVNRREFLKLKQRLWEWSPRCYFGANDPNYDSCSSFFFFCQCRFQGVDAWRAQKCDFKKCESPQTFTTICELLIPSGGSVSGHPKK